VGNLLAENLIFLSIGEFTPEKGLRWVGNVVSLFNVMTPEETLCEAPFV